MKPPKLILALLLTGCAYQPLQTYEKPDGVSMSVGQYQPKIASVSHWKAIAENEAKLIKDRLAYKPLIVQQDNSSNFSAAFYDLLSSSLTSNGAVVHTAIKPADITVSYKIKVVTNPWGSGPPDIQNSSWESVLVYYYIRSAFQIIRAPLQEIKDQFAKNLETPTELLITTQAANDRQILYSSSNVYYIEGSSMANYGIALPPPPPPRPRMMIDSFPIAVDY